MPRRVARTVLRGDRRSNAAVLPDRHRSVIVRQTVAGEQLSVTRIGNDPIVLAEEIGKAGECPEVVLEATYGWYWAADGPPSS